MNRIEAPYAPRRGRCYKVLDDGTVVVDPAKRSVVPYSLTTGPIHVPGVTQIVETFNLLDGRAQPANVSVDNKGPFEIVATSFEAHYTSERYEGLPADDLAVAILDAYGQMVVMNREVHITTIFGGFGSAWGVDDFGTARESAGGRPFVWPESFFMDPSDTTRMLLVSLRNLGVDDIEAKITFHGVRYYHPRPYQEAVKFRNEYYGEGRISYPYFYTPDTDIYLAGVGATGDSAIVPMRITDNADAEIFKMTKRSAHANFLWRLVEHGERALDPAGIDPATGFQGVPARFGFGDGEFPFIPFETMYYPLDTQLELWLQNLDTVHLYPWLTFIARRITHVGKDWLGTAPGLAGRVG